MRVRFEVLLLCALVAGTTGCSNIRTNADYDPSVNFTTLRTYDWRADGKQAPQDPRIDNTLFASRVHQAVDRQLAAKGYQQSTNGNPDFLVGYHAVVEGKVDFRTVGGYYGYGGWGTAPQTYAYNYDEGTLLLDVIQPETMQLLWRGSATATVRPSATPVERQKRINEAIEKILSKFPPQ